MLDSHKLHSQVPFCSVGCMAPSHIHGWYDLQTAVGNATASQLFLRPSVGVPPMTTASFLAEPITIGVTRDEHDNFVQLPDPSGVPIYNLHVLINAYIAELGAVKVIGGDIHFGLSLLRAYYSSGFSHSYSIEFTQHRKGSATYSGPHINMRQGDAVCQSTITTLDYHDLTLATPHYLAALTGELRDLKRDES